MLTHEDAKPKMERICSGQEEIKRALGQLGAMAEFKIDLAREADRLAGLAADFAARAQELRGPALRELLTPWIEDASFDKVSRVLEFTVRRVPQLAVNTIRAPEGQHDPHGVWTRITFPAHERDARRRYRTPSYKIATVVTLETPAGRKQRQVQIDQYAA